MLCAGFFKAVKVNLAMEESLQVSVDMEKATELELYEVNFFEYLSS